MDLNLVLSRKLLNTNLGIYFKSVVDWCFFYFKNTIRDKTPMNIPLFSFFSLFFENCFLRAENGFYYLNLVFSVFFRKKKKKKR